MVQKFIIQYFTSYFMTWEKNIALSYNIVETKDFYVLTCFTNVNFVHVLMYHASGQWPGLFKWGEGFNSGIWFSGGSLKPPSPPSNSSLPMGVCIMFHFVMDRMLCLRYVSCKSFSCFCKWFWYEMFASWNIVNVIRQTWLIE